MKKKILVSLLAGGAAATPLAMQANVTLDDLVTNGNKWQVDGISAENPTQIDSDLANGIIDCPQAAGGTVLLSLRDGDVLPAGTYVLTAETANNVAVSASGEGVASSSYDADNKTLTFILSADTKVTLTVSGTVPWKFGKLSLYIICDNQEIAQNVKDTLAGIVPDTLPSIAAPALPANEECKAKCEEDDDYKTLKAEYDGLVEELNGAENDGSLAQQKAYLETAIGALSEENITLQNYLDYVLDPEDTSKVKVEEAAEALAQQYGDTFAPDLASYNAKRKIWDKNIGKIPNFLDNFGKLLDSINGLIAQVDALSTKDVEGIDVTEKAYVTDKINELIATFKCNIKTDADGQLAPVGFTDLKGFADAVANGMSAESLVAYYGTYDEDKSTLEGSYWYRDDYAGGADYAGNFAPDIQDALNAAKADYQAYEAYLADLDRLATAYETAYSNTSDLNVNYQSVVQKQLENLYSNGDESVEGRTAIEDANTAGILGAKDREQGNTAKIQALINALNNFAQAAIDNQAACKSIYDSLTSEDTGMPYVKGLLDNLKEQAEALTESDVKDALINRIQAELDALDALEPNVEENWLNCDLEGLNENLETLEGIYASINGDDTAESGIASDLQNAKDRDSAYTAAIANLDNYLTQLNAARDAMDAVLDGVSAKFSSAYNNVVKAINNAKAEAKAALNAGESWTLPQDDQTYIVEGIATYATGKDFAEAYKALNAKYDELTAANTGESGSFQALINELKPTDLGNNATLIATAEATVGDLTKAIEEAQANLTKIYNENNEQALIDAFNAAKTNLQAEIDGLSGQIAEAETTFALSFVQTQLATLTPKVTDLKTIFDQLEDTYPGYAALKEKVDALNEAYGKVYADVEAQAGPQAEPDVATLKTDNTTIVGLYNQLIDTDTATGLITEAGKVRDNQYYHELLAQAYTSIGLDLSTLRTCIEQNTQDPAKDTALNSTTWENKYEAPGVYTYAQLAALLENLQETEDGKYQAVGLTEAEYNDLKAQLDNYSGYAQTNIPNYLTVNEQKHNEQVVAGTETLNKLKETIAKVNEYDQDIVLVYEKDEEGNIVAIEKTVATVKADLEALRNKISALNQDVYNAYRDLVSAYITPAYGDIQTEINTLYNAVTDNYLVGLETANQQVFDNVVTPAYDAMMKLYWSAVNEYRLYTEVIPSNSERPTWAQNINIPDGGYNTYEPYRTKLLEVLTVENYAAIFNRFDELQQVYTNAKAILTQANADAAEALENGTSSEDLQPLTVEDFASILQTIYGTENEPGINASLQKYKDSLAETAGNTADAYFEAEREKASLYIQAAGNAMDDAGIPYDPYQKDALEDANTALAKAIADYEAFSNDETYKLQSLRMSVLINDLAGVVVDTNAAAKAYWTAEVTDTDALSAAVDKMLNDTYKDYSGLDQLRYQYQEVAAQLAGLKATVDSDNSLIDNINDDIDVLDGINTKLNEYKDAITNYVQQNSNNTEAKAGDLNKINGEGNENSLEAQLAALRAKVGLLDMPWTQVALIGMNGIEAQIEALATLVKGMDVDDYNTVTVNERIDEIADQIAAGYQIAAQEEAKFIPSRFTEVTKLFNDTYGDEYDPATSTDYTANQAYTNLAAAELKKDLANTAIQNGEYEKAIDLFAEAEDLLNAAEAVLKGGTPEANPATQEVLDVLNSAYDALSDRITEAESTLADESKLIDDTKVGDSEELAATLNGIKTQLDVLKGLWERDGNVVVGRQERYEELIGILEGRLNDFNTELDELYQAAEQKKALNDKNAADVQHDINWVKGQVDAFKTRVEGFWPENMPESVAQDLRVMYDDLDKAQAQLESTMADYSTPTVAGFPDLGNAAGRLNSAKQNANFLKTDEMTKAANKAYEAANAAVKDVDHLNQAELDEELAYITDLLPFAVVVNSSVNATADASIAVAQQIIELSNALAAKAEDRKIILGDVNEDGEVTLDDYEDLIDYILNKESNVVDQENKKDVAADVNRDGKLTTADLRALVKMIINQGSGAAVMARVPVPQGLNFATIETVSEVNGVRTLAICLDNANSFVNFQFDLVMPDGLKLVGENVAERAASLNLLSNDLSDSRHRVLVLDNSDSSLDGHNGAVVYIRVQGEGIPAIEEFNASDALGHNFGIDCSQAPGSTGIDSISDYLKAGKEYIYDLSGRILNKLQNGWNIIRRADGSTEKVYHQDK